jgi:hypothetical protein
MLPVVKNPEPVIAPDALILPVRFSGLCIEPVIIGESIVIAAFYINIINTVVLISDLLLMYLGMDIEMVLFYALRFDCCLN